MLPTRAAAIAAAATCAAFARRSGSVDGALMELRGLFAKYTYAYNAADAAAVTITISDATDATPTAFFAEDGEGEDIATGEVFKVGGNGDTTDDAFETAKGSAPAAGDRFIKASATAVAFVSAAAATLAAIDDELDSVSEADAAATVIATRAAVISAAAVVGAFVDLSYNRAGYYQEARALFEDYRPQFAAQIAAASVLVLHDAKNADLEAFYAAGGGGEQILAAQLFTVASAVDTTDDAFETAKGTAPAAGNVFQRTGATSIDYMGATVAAVSAALAAAVEIDVTDETDADVAAFLDGGQGDALAAGDFFTTADTHDFTDNALATLKGGALAADDMWFVTSATTLRFIAAAAGVAAVVASAASAADREAVAGGADLTAFFAGGQGSGIAIGESFSVSSTADTNDNALQTAKGSAVAAADVFQRNGATSTVFIGAGAATLAAVDAELDNE